METLKLPNERIWFDKELLDVPAELSCEAPYWYVQDKVVGTAKGRGITWFVQLSKLQGALRHYRRGGLFGKLVKDSYLFKGWQTTRSYQEFILLKNLRESGVNVPRPIAARAKKSGLTYRADLLSERIPNASDLVAILEKNTLSSEIYSYIGKQIKRLHQAQVNHTDLNIHNILLDNRDKVWIIDFDKCYQQEGEGWKPANLERLKRSFLKEVERFGINWQESDWDILIESYRETI
ncbi:3-deoxy-D-manno-octulosonic acid kinase [Vibrio ishigakensis]|uniref:3-deoxy-D-manno-octulosonic acid kinase n=1 Tax=Vibrio ishigakensis TaxID=1481914 RepID=A0A0B8NVD3_9VIBR|nr:3-deoxy-D-manno-octulosonic acid kinase [Vibrio ishigakensis]GAM54714.1 3-deoxy-D-manno-octulosonic acid kinase [Vibrio ishigakensis]